MVQFACDGLVIIKLLGSVIEHLMFGWFDIVMAYCHIPRVLEPVEVWLGCLGGV